MWYTRPRRMSWMPCDCIRSEINTETLYRAIGVVLPLASVRTQSSLLLFFGRLHSRFPRLRSYGCRCVSDKASIDCNVSLHKIVSTEIWYQPIIVQYRCISLQILPQIRLFSIDTHTNDRHENQFIPAKHRKMENLLLPIPCCRFYFFFCRPQRWRCTFFAPFSM